MFINRKIDAEEFGQQFSKLRKENMDASAIRKANFENEINLQLNPKSQGFTTITSSIYAAIDLFDSDVDELKVGL